MLFSLYFLNFCFTFFIWNIWSNLINVFNFFIGGVITAGDGNWSWSKFTWSDLRFTRWDHLLNYRYLLPKISGFWATKVQNWSGCGPHERHSHVRTWALPCLLTSSLICGQANKSSGNNCLRLNSHNNFTSFHWNSALPSSRWNIRDILMASQLCNIGKAHTWRNSKGWLFSACLYSSHQISSLWFGWYFTPTRGREREATCQSCTVMNYTSDRSAPVGSQCCVSIQILEECRLRFHLTVQQTRVKYAFWFFCFFFSWTLLIWQYIITQARLMCSLLCAL